MFKIPFGWLPAHWGLKGPIREEARIYYEISDQKEREIAIAKLRNKDDEKKLNLALLEIEKKYNNIDDFSYEIRKVELIYEDKDKIEEEKNEILFKYKKISELEYEKNKANIKKEPFIKISSEFIIELNGDQKFGFKFDWNDYFIKFLEENGYRGLNEEMIVEKWFNDIIKLNLLENLDEDVVEEYINNRQNRRNNFLRKINKNNDANGRSEYS